MGNGEWGMGNGEWGMENGKWKMENGKWKMEKERHAKMERANEKELAVGQALENRNLSRVPLLKSRRTRLGGRIVQSGFKLGARRNALESLDNLAILEEQKRRNRIDPVLR